MSRAPFWSFPFCPEPPSWSLDWDGIEAEFDWIRKMKGCPQDPIHHAEGDVYTHTRMVAEELISLSFWQELPAAARSTVFASALLHDVAKPAYTQKEADGRITSRGHTGSGARMARQILWQMDDADTPVPFHYREMVVALVRYSGLPFFLFERPNPQRSIIQASQIVRCDWLALLEEADARGRKCDDRQDLLDRVELFREFCKENKCLNGSRQFASPQSRFVYFRKEDGNPDYEAYDDTQFEVVLMSGLPGAGKDSWIRSHLPDWPVVSLDALRKEMKIPAHKNQGPVAQRAKERAREYLRVGRSFVWNATNITRSMRSQLIDLFTDYRARVRIVYVESPYRELIKRNRSREETVPASIIQKLASRLDIPDLTEAQNVEWVVT